MNSEQALTLSVVVPTRNRSDRLAGLLASLGQCPVASGFSVELIVADNGSTDHTREVIAQAARRLPFPVRYACEPVRGVARARNAGARISRGPLIAFVDDDCEVQPDWMMSLLAAFEERPDLAGLFGRVLPADGAPVDATTLSVKPSTQPQDFRFPCSPFIGHGNNMAFRREAFLGACGFDVDYGPGARLRCAEELELSYRLLRRGAWLRYEPRVVVRHLPRATQEELLAAHSRNAIGLGACFMKHALRADAFAARTAWWWWQATWRSYWQAGRSGAAAVRRVKALYLRGFLYGLLLRVGYEIVRIGDGVRAMRRPKAAVST